MEESTKGHEGAGGFSNELTLIHEESLEIVSAAPTNDKNGRPLQRGWSSGCSLSNGEKNKLAVFGGLSGNDETPTRLNDLWICTISAK